MEPRGSRKQSLKKRQRRRALRWGMIVGGLCILFALVVFAQHADVNHAEKSGPQRENTSKSPQKQGAAKPPVQEQTGQGKDGQAKPPAVTPQKPGKEADPEPTDNESTKGGVKEPLTVSVVGDILLGGPRIASLLEKNGYDYPYTEVKDYLKNADITVGNLETAVTTRGSAQEKTYVFRSDPKTLPALKEAGFDVLNLANNHVLDYGQVGLSDTLANLEKADISYVGAGNNAKEAFTPVYIKRKNSTIAIVGFSRVAPKPDWFAGSKTPGIAGTYSPAAAVAAIKEAKKHADAVIVIVHWGIERSDYPNDVQTDLGHKYIDAGADLVLGGHPHVLQGFELYKDKWIAYSLGNFIFTSNQVKKTWESMILQATFKPGKPCELKVVPVNLQSAAKPKPMDEAAGKRLFQRLTSLSKKAVVGSDGIVAAK